MQHDLPKAVEKLEIPLQYKNEVLRELLKMNLHRASLFPDPDGYALSVKLRYNSLKTPGEVAAETDEKRANLDYLFFP